MRSWKQEERNIIQAMLCLLMSKAICYPVLDIGWLLWCK